MAPRPDLTLYSRAECSLCDEAREAIRLVIADREARGLAVPTVVERDIEADAALHRELLERIPVVELGDRRVELIVTVGKVRRLLNEALGSAATPDAAELADAADAADAAGASDAAPTATVPADRASSEG